MPSTALLRVVLALITCLALASTGTVLAIDRPVADAADGPGVDTSSIACTGVASGAGTDGDAENVSVRAFVAPGRTFDSLRTASALHEHRANGTLSPASVGVDRTWEDRVVAMRDVAVVRFDLNGSATGLLDRLAAQDEGSTTANFVELVAGPGFAFEYWGASACPPELALNASVENGAFRVVADRANDSFSLVMDVDRLLFYAPGDDEPTRDTYVDGHNRLSLTVRASTGLVSENATDGTEYVLEEASVFFGTDHVGLARVGDGDWTLEGITSLAPGSSVQLGLQPFTASGGNATLNATVNATRHVVVDLTTTPVDGNTTYRVHVPELAGSKSSQDTPVFLVVGNATAAAVDAENATTTGEIYYGPSATTTDGGFAVVRNETGGIVGVSEYHPPGRVVFQPHLSPALRENQTVTVTLYRDVNDDRTFDSADEPYRVNGTPVRDAAYVRIHPDESTTTRTTAGGTSTGPAGTTPDTTTSMVPDPADQTNTSTGETPGFGAIAVVAVLLAAVLGLRRE